MATLPALYLGRWRSPEVMFAAALRPERIAAAGVRLRFLALDHGAGLQDPTFVIVVVDDARLPVF